MDVFGYFSRMVSEGNEEEIYKVLGLLPLDQLEYEPILRVLLSNCLDVGRVDYGKIVFDYFSDQNIRERDLPLITEVFGYKSFDTDLLTFISKMYPKIDSVDHIANLIKWEDSSSQIATAERIIEIYEEIPSCQVISAYNLAQDNQNWNMMRWLKEKVKMLKIPAPVPEWMIQAPEKFKTLATVPELLETYELPDPEVAVDIIINLLGQGGIKARIIDQSSEIPSLNENEELDPLTKYRKAMNIRDYWTKRYAELSDSSKRDYLREYFEAKIMVELAADPEYFRILGPANLQPGRIYLDRTSRCYLYGGCRMFLCNHDENDEEVDEEVDWYSGFCDYCNREIENRFRATRQPPVLGGWQGCFCSTVCAELNGAIPPKNDEIDDTQLLVLEKKLLQFKIYDRPDTQIIPVAPSVELELVENPVIVVNTTEEIEPSTQLASMLKRMGYTD